MSRASSSLTRAPHASGGLGRPEFHLDLGRKPLICPLGVCDDTGFPDLHTNSGQAPATTDLPKRQSRRPQSTTARVTLIRTCACFWRTRDSSRDDMFHATAHQLPRRHGCAACTRGCARKQQRATRGTTASPIRQFPTNEMGKLTDATWNQSTSLKTHPRSPLGIRLKMKIPKKNIYQRAHTSEGGLHRCITDNPRRCYCHPIRAEKRPVESSVVKASSTIPPLITSSPRARLLLTTVGDESKGKKTPRSLA